ncbi:MAG TPA: VOC family protein [Patescibacteria group bacterium]|nr:VOC family protein [Patescibacteria group bacterium]
MLSNAPITPVLPATDIARAKKFYTEILGLKESATQMSSDTVLFECGKGSKLFIYQRPPAPSQHTLASFEVEDLEAEMAELRSRGLVFEEYDMPGLKTVNGIAEMGEEKAAWFKDSEGNILALDQKVT